MTRSSTIPRLCTRRSPSTGTVLAFAWFNRRRVSFGPLSDDARKRYNATVARWIANGGRLPDEDASTTGPYLVEDLVADYLDHASTYYRDPTSGAPGGEYENVRGALRHLLETCAELPAVEFGPLALQAVRAAMLDSGRLCRKEINARVHRIRRAFRWAASMQHLPAAVAQALATVDGLKAGRSVARESQPVRPVDEATVRETAAFLPATVADMVWLQWWTGCRPAELVAMRWRDVDRSGRVWLYRPERHKTSWRGRERVVAIGPHGQEVLGRHLKLDPLAHVFSPAASEAERNARRRLERASPMTPSQAARRPKARPQRAPGASYDVHSYRRAIHRACDAANAARLRDAMVRSLDAVVPAQTRARIAALSVRALLDPSTGACRIDRAAVERALRSVPAQAVAELGVRAIHAAGSVALLERWSPHRLRHAAATRIRKEEGLEAARVVLGHARAAVTEVYAAVDQERSLRIMERLG